jgi:hypothetical protein
MAIHSAHYHALKELHSLGELPQNGRILEIGEANFYCDMPLDTIRDDIVRLCAGPKRDVMLENLESAASRQDLFEICKVIYWLFFNHKEWVAIDISGTEKAYKCDLNESIDFGCCLPFAVAINHGTAEHIFNVANVFRIMHEQCRPGLCRSGGLLIHESPFTGWIDHGFYTIQPTLYYDLAAANEYDIRYLAVTSLSEPLPHRVESREQLLEMAQLGTLPDNAMLFVAMRKTSDKPFRIPMQGVYANTLSNKAVELWHMMR